MNHSISYNCINSTLKKFPKLFEIFGEIKNKNIRLTSPIYKQNKGLNHKYTFYGILNSPDSRRWSNFLKKLDALSKKLDRLYSSSALKEGISNDPFSFLSELEFADYCLSRGFKILEVHPKLSNGKKLDLRIEFEDNPTLVEIITPHMKKNMVEIECGFFPISAGLENNIHHEFEEHKIINNNIREQFVIVIAGDYATVDEINLQAAIEEFVKKYQNESMFLTGVFLNRMGFYEYFKNEYNQKKIIEASLT